MLELICKILLNFKSEIGALNFEQIYKVEGHRVANENFFKASHQLSYAEAVGFCRRERADLFYVRQNYDLAAIFQSLAVTSVWVDMTKSKVTGKWMDARGYAPVSKTLNDTLGMKHLVETTEGTRNVILEHSEQTFNYKLIDSDPVQTKETICKRNLSFPYRQADLDILEKMVTSMTDMTEQMHEKAYHAKDQARAKIALLPKMKKGLKMAVEGTVNLQKIVEEKIGNSTTRLEEMVVAFSNMTDSNDVSIKIGRCFSRMLQVANLVDSVMQIVDNPFASVNETFYPLVENELNSTLPSILFEVSPDMFLLKIGASKLQIAIESDYFYKITLVDLILIGTGSSMLLVAFCTLCLAVVSRRKEQKKKEKRQRPFQTNAIRSVDTPIVESSFGLIPKRYVPLEIPGRHVGTRPKTNRKPQQIQTVTRTVRYDLEYRNDKPLWKTASELTINN